MKSDSEFESQLLNLDELTFSIIDSQTGLHREKWKKKKKMERG